MKQPVNLNLMTLRFPVTAIVSILHRVSGVLLFLSIPVFLYLLDESLISSEAFAGVYQLLSHWLAKFFIWSLLLAFLYHFLAGVRHLIMDMGIGEDLAAAKQSSWVVFGLMLVLGVLLGVWLWV